MRSELFRRRSEKSQRLRKRRKNFRLRRPSRLSKCHPTFVNWSSGGDKTGTSILNKLKQVSSSCDVHFQWIHSHVDRWGNEEADTLVKEGARESLATYNCLTYLELYSARKHIDKKTWLVPPVHTWYRANSPRGSFALNCDRPTPFAPRRQFPDFLVDI
ncbi:UNVERIFIED_CONTAM: hypothetical protein NCL1_53505 [Trichonephila clavipes]